MRGRDLDRSQGFCVKPAVTMANTADQRADVSIHHGKLDTGVLLLAKPYRKSDLARMVRRALDG